MESVHDDGKDGTPQGPKRLILIVAWMFDGSPSPQVQELTVIQTNHN